MPRVSRWLRAWWARCDPSEEEREPTGPSIIRQTHCASNPRRAIRQQTAGLQPGIVHVREGKSRREWFSAELETQPQTIETEVVSHPKSSGEFERDLGNADMQQVDLCVRKTQTSGSNRARVKHKYCDESFRTIFL